MTEAQMLRDDHENFVGEFTTIEEEDDPNDNYPPMGEPEWAILVVLNEDQYTVVKHTGRFFHAQCICAGEDGELVGIDDIPCDPGAYIFSGGKVWTTKDWETGIQDDYGISGDIRRLTPEEYKKYFLTEEESV